MGALFLKKKKNQRKRRPCGGGERRKRETLGRRGVAFIGGGAWLGLPSWPCALGLGFFYREERRKREEGER